MKIVVTGGNGNIGAHIIRELLQRGYDDIVCFDRTECPAPLDHVQYLVGDRHNEQEYIDTMHRLAPDVAFELTCFNAQDAKVSIAAFRGVKHFITASTVCTYGKNFSHFPMREEDWFEPCTEYGINKHAADLVYLEAFRREGFPVTIMKPCTSYSGMSGMLRSLTTEHTWIDRVKKGKPILGICRGMQFINVYFGGTLIQDLPCSASHKAATPEQYHDVLHLPATFMEALYGETSEVNTRHHQGIGRIGENLQVVSIWNDGEDSVVEAIACEQHSILGLQWHPEKMFLYGNENQRTDAKKLLQWFLTLEGEK